MESPSAAENDRRLAALARRGGASGAAPPSSSRRTPVPTLGFAPVFYSLAAVYLKAGQGSDALACVREAIRLQPEFEDARALEQKVLAGLE